MMHRRFHTSLLASTALALLSTPLMAGPPTPPPPTTLPQGPQTQYGNGTYTYQNNQLTIQQLTQLMITNWTTFDIGSNAFVQFLQPGSNSIALERVMGGFGPSQIFGAMQANGMVFLVNSNGILFGQGSQVNVGSLLATTHDIKNSDFIAGKYNFNIAGNPSASIVNQGTITAAQGGFAALVAPGVRNTGTISATLGTVGLAASGKGFTLDMYGDKLINLAVGDQIAGQVIDVSTGKPLTSYVSNEGKLSANGGRVELTAASAKTVIDSVINNTGVIEANSIGQHNGTIVLSAATGDTKQKGDPTQTIKIGGTISAKGGKSGETGGTIKITGENIALKGAKIDASGMAGGGTVQIGAPPTSGVGAGLKQWPTETITADASTVIDVSAIQNGNGGRVGIWSDFTTFGGQILATGGALGGNGGFVETSGHIVDLTGIRVDTRAPLGTTGTWLIDPDELTIDATLAATINAELANLTNVRLMTDTGDINVNSAISWTTKNTFELDAGHDINVNATITLSNGRLNLNANNAIAINSLVNITSAGSVNLNTGTGIYGNALLSFGSGGSMQFAPPGDSDFRASLNINDESYRLIYSLSDLQNMNLSGNYALANSVSLASIANWAPLGDFSGRFEGLGNTIDHLTIAPTNSSINNIGFFSMIDAGGTVSDLRFTNASITANPNVSGPGQFIGVLAGQNAGMVSGVSATGQINGLNLAGVIAGGLVGQNGMFGDGNQYGTIVGSSANVGITLGNGTSCGDGCQFNYAGGLVGNNPGLIANSSASGNVIVGANADGGGLVGSNGIYTNGDGNGVVPGFIYASSASGTVSSAGLNVQLGGLVGQNTAQSIILGSTASGDVTATAAVTKTHTDCSTSSTCEYVSVGGLVGQNSGTILLSGASGNVSVGSEGTAGGLVGSSDGIIGLSWATGNVTGAAGKAGDSGHLFDNSTTLGGLVGSNAGFIYGSYATGNVGSAGVAYLGVGGLVGDNSGTIAASYASGSVSAGDFSVAGGLVGDNSRGDSVCNVCIPGDGQQYFNTATIIGSSAYGNVTVGATSVAGGFAGAADGLIMNGFASGSVTAGGNSVVGGLAGILDVGGQIIGSIAQNTLVSSTGPNSAVGGLVGTNGGLVSDSTFTGAVSGGPDSYIGGLIGVNFGSVLLSTANATVTGTGANDIVGGLAGLNVGSLTDSTASVDLVANGAGSIVGGVAGVNGSFTFTGPNPFITASLSTTQSTTLTGTYDGSTATGSGFSSQIGSAAPPSAPQFPNFVPGCNATLCDVINNGMLQLGAPNPPPVTPPISPPPPITQQIQFVPPTTTDPTTPVFTPISLGTGGTGATGGRGGSGGTTGSTGGTGTGATSPRPGGNGAPAGTRLIDMPQIPLPPGSGLPPLGETRFLSNEVVFQIRNASAQQIADIAGRFGLTVGTCEELGLLGRTVCNFRITDGRPVRDVIRAVEAAHLSAWTGPVYTYGFTQQEPAGTTADPDPNANMGDPAQYVIGKFQLSESHRLTKGDNVIVAVIDSEIDSRHPDLAGVVTNRFDAGCGASAPDAHGTGMTGAIAAHRNLMGVAPNVKIIAICAFGGDAASAESTSIKIIKGIDFAITQGARVINMSFAGPRDPALAQALQIAREKGIVLIGAAGNAGPKSPPLFPGADPNVIAVTATDDHDRLFNRANQGKYIAVAAPGVDILVPAPNNSLQLTTGTSVATAHVSGVAALLIAQNPKRTPDEIRSILVSTAKDLGAKGFDPQFGAGLVDPLKALRLAPVPVADKSAALAAPLPTPVPASPPAKPKSVAFAAPGLGR